MGQQQLLLLVLGIVIVGLAVVVGIQAFSENQAKSSADALVNDSVNYATKAIAWFETPTTMGGGGGVDPTDLSMAKLGATTDENGIATTPSGHYSAGAIYTSEPGVYFLEVFGCNPTKTQYTQTWINTGSKETTTTSGAVPGVEGFPTAADCPTPTTP